MTVSWGAPRDPEREVLEREGRLHDWFDRAAVSDDELEHTDRLHEKGGEPWRQLARQPHPRERREHRRARQQELDARLALYPDRAPSSDVWPLGRVA